MAFQKEEIIYYAVIFVLGCAGALSREWRDGNRRSSRRVVGSVFSGGLFSFGGVGVWCGHNPDSIVSPMYFLGVAAFVGFYSLEIQDVLQRAIRGTITSVLKRFGIEVERDDTQNQSSCNE